MRVCFIKKSGGVGESRTCVRPSITAYISISQSRCFIYEPWAGFVCVFFVVVVVETHNKLSFRVELGTCVRACVGFPFVMLATKAITCLNRRTCDRCLTFLRQQNPPILLCFVRVFYVAGQKKIKYCHHDHKAATTAIHTTPLAPDSYQCLSAHTRTHTRALTSITLRHDTLGRVKCVYSALTGRVWYGDVDDDDNDNDTGGRSFGRSVRPVASYTI